MTIEIESAWDWVRLVNMAVALMGISALISVRRMKWQRYTDKMKDLWRAMLGWMVLVVLATVEILLSIETEIRVLLVSVVLIYSITGIRRRGDYTAEPSGPRGSGLLDKKQSPPGK